MKNSITKKQLQKFEDRIANLFEAGKIKYPIHLTRGNENELIKIFQNVKSGDWIFSTHRSHLHYLLAGGNSDKLEKEIIKGHSMHLFDRDIPLLTSSIVGGICPIAVGVALSLKRKNSTNKVFCFIGDMAAETGLAHECIKYSERNNLPILFVIEDNGMSVDTLTQNTWGKNKKIICTYKYKYKRKKWPHAGIGKWIVL